MQKILVIEDDLGIRGALVDILELEGYQPLSAADGLAGVALARQECPDLILCDIMMPYLDGYGVLSELRKSADTATIPFIFLTARTTAVDVRAGMNLGADDYLTKPFCAEDLLRTIRARMERHTKLAAKLQERVNELQSNLMNVLPHELNTPLHSVLAGIEFLRDDFATLERSDVEELLRIVHQAALRMRRLVGNSLLHAELANLTDAPTLPRAIERAPVITVRQYIEMVVEQEAMAVARQGDIYLELTDAPVRILHNHLSKIVEELVNNALQYSQSGTPIKVVGQSTDESYSLTISDHGRGLSQEEIAAINAFRQFQRRQYEQQGLGLGLSLVQRLLAHYQGQFSIESVPGKGTSVQVRLPLADPSNPLR